MGSAGSTENTQALNGVQVSHEPSAHESGLAVRGDGWLRSILPIWLLH